MQVAWNVIYSKKSLSPTTNNTNFFVHINDYSCSVIFDIFRSSCTIYNKDFTILFVLIFHCRTLDNIFTCENIGAVISRNETKICISQSKFFRNFRSFFSSFDSNKIHTILTSLNTVITAFCVQYLVRATPDVTEVIGSRYQFYCIPVYILPIHLFSIGSKLNGISS